MILLETKDLHVFYKNGQDWLNVVNQVNISLEENRTYGIIGESGSGKTSLVLAILGLLNPKTSQVEGQVIFQGQDLRSLSAEAFNEIRWEEIAVVFQNSMNALSPIHRIQRQIEDIYQTHRPHVRRSQIKEEVLAIFKLLNLSGKAYQAYPHELSGGMMQRVAIAMSLIFNPKLIILDEATTALDIITQNKILNELKVLDAKYHNTKLIVTHDLSVVRQTCDYVYLMYQGQIVEEGDMDQVFHRPQHPYTQTMVANYFKLTRGKGGKS